MSSFLLISNPSKTDFSYFLLLFSVQPILPSSSAKILAIASPSTLFLLFYSTSSPFPAPVIQYSQSPPYRTYLRLLYCLYHCHLSGSTFHFSTAFIIATSLVLPFNSLLLLSLPPLKFYLPLLSSSTFHFSTAFIIATSLVLPFTYLLPLSLLPL